MPLEPRGERAKRPPLRERLREAVRVSLTFGLAWGAVALVSSLVLYLVYGVLREPPKTSREGLVVAEKFLLLFLGITAVPVIWLPGKKNRE